MLRTHKEIIEDGGGWRDVRAKLGHTADDTRVKFWYWRDSIPSEYWMNFSECGLASFDELANAHMRKKYLRNRNPKAHLRPTGRPRKAAVR